MNLGLNETKVLADIAKLLYSFLPGSAPPFGRTYTFADAARDANVENFWIGGSKEPAIQQLLELTYARRRERFPHLITRIVHESIKYRQKKGSPLTRQELISLNSLLLRIGIEVPEIHETTFLESLSSDELGERSLQYVDPVRLAQLLTRYKNLLTNPDHQSRGYELQDIIYALFDLYNLKPRSPFRVIGEEIDGSFELDHEIYLLEARWRKSQATHSDLINFSSKVQGKAEWSRGLFLSMAGFAPEALKSVMQGRRPNFIVMSGSEFEMCIKDRTNLIDLLREKVRAAAERGQIT